MNTGTNTRGPRVSDLLRLLNNVRCVEGARGNLHLIDGSYAECEARSNGGRRPSRMFRITTKTRIGSTGWINQKTALKWAHDQDAKADRDQTSDGA